MLIYLTALALFGAVGQAGHGSPAAQEKPKIEKRAEQFYVAIHVKSPVDDLDKVIPQSIREVLGWMSEKGMKPTGVPFTRFLVVDMPTSLDLDIGIPVAKRSEARGRIHGGSLPAGRYVTYVLEGDPQGLVGANAFIRTWANEDGLKLDHSESDKGVGWRSRVERYLFSPMDQPDRSKWRTEVDYLIAP